MDGRQFVALVKGAMGPTGSRRGLLQILGASAGLSLGLGLSLDRDEAVAGERRKKKQRRRRRRRRIERRKLQICHDETLIKVRRKAVEAHLQHGDQLESCDLLQGVQTCDNPKLPCNTDPAVCSEQDGCFCYVTTTGGSICATNGIECLAGKTCVVDSDCTDRLGSGFACVPTFGCDLPGCTDTGNACSQTCQQ